MDRRLMSPKPTMTKVVAAHSAEFRRILAESKSNREIWRKIRIITHTAPLLIFWVAPDGKVLKAVGSHRQSPPNGDRSVFCPGHKGYLRGRAAQIGDTIYVVIYVRPDGTLSKNELELLANSRKNIKFCLKLNHPDYKGVIDRAIFVDEYGLFL